MRKTYNAPVAKLIDYSYQEQIKAESFNCDSVRYDAVTTEAVRDCEEYRQFILVVSRSLADPCKHESPFRPM